MKAQVSLEYATTYGWALVIMLVIVGSLIFYGMVETDSRIETDCYIGPQFICDDVFLTKEGGLGIKFTNYINEKIKISSISLNNFPDSQCQFNNEELAPSMQMVILCDLNKEIFEGDVETIFTTTNFSINDTFNENGEEIIFFTKGKILINVNKYLDNYACDIDGDGYESELPGCLSEDCDDSDPDWYQAQCVNDNDCSAGQECLGAGSCRAECVEINCDQDNDGYLRDICGGNDCNDNNYQINIPVCNQDSDCDSRFVLGRCFHPGTCMAYCAPKDPPGDELER